MIKGKVKVHYNELDDFIILRSDGSPTYMLSVVVDDHDMGITHVIRGDDHFTNTFRQICIYNACGWNVPKFGHLPLIFGDDGKKLSKRRQVVGINDFRDLGYTSEALRLYIGTMGYSVNLKSVTFEEILKTFNIKKVSKSAVQFDISFLNIINQQVIKSDKKYLLEAIPFIQKNYQGEIKLDVLDRAYQDIASRSKTLVDFANLSMMYLTHNKTDFNFDQCMLNKIIESFKSHQFENYDLNEIKTFLQEFINLNQYTNENVYTMLRLCLTGLENTPNVCNIMYALGETECLDRLSKYLS
jgi:glutamyl-tRNA synthetase